MKTLILGDTHGRSNWKQVLEAHPDAGGVVFMGDYFDSFDISGVEQLHNFNEIIRCKEETDKEVIMLVGNHDHHYLDVGETYSGYKAAHKWDFQDALNKNMHHLQIAYLLDDVLFTHAGVSPIWMDDTFYRQVKQGWSKDTIGIPTKIRSRAFSTGPSASQISRSRSVSFTGSARPPTCRLARASPAAGMRLIAPMGSPSTRIIRLSPARMAGR